MTPDTGAGAGTPARESTGEPRVERLVEVFDPDGRAEAATLPLRDLLRDARSVVLLGDPGMGKTTALEYAEAALPGSSRWRVQIFVPSTTFHILAGGTLLLDALDEAVAAGVANPLGTVAARLHDLGRPRFWLSCRAVDWVGQGGAALLREEAPFGLVVARLLPLDDRQIAELARSRNLVGTDLLEAMRGAGLMPLLRNPWTLNLTFEVAAAGGLPRSQYDLFQRATELLTRERRDRPGGNRPGGGRVAPSAILDAAGAVCAALLISGTSAVTTGVGNPVVPSVDAFDPIAPSIAVEAARRTRLFAAVGEDAWEPQHRTLAEFLGARFLADCIWRGGLSLRRVLALLCGAAPAPHPSLRGLFAWLVTMAPPIQAEQLAEIDPYGVLSYGDPTRVAPAARRALLTALGELAGREPWFRAHRWGEARLGPLAIPELVPELRGVLAERPARPHLLSCVCDAVSEGEPRPELVGDLEALLTDPRVPADVRAFAVEAYLRASSAQPGAACALFGKLLAQPLLDPEAHLTGSLFLRLYPERLGTADVAAFLDRWVGCDGDDGLLIPYRLPRIVPAGDEAELLDVLATREWAVRQDAAPLTRVFEAQEIIGALAARAIRALPAADTSRAAAWFGLLAAYPVREKEEFREALAARGDLFVPLVITASEDLDPTEVAQAPWVVLSRLEQALLQWRWPPDAAARLLSAARSETAPPRAVRLFAAALDVYMRAAQPDIGWFEEAWSFGHGRTDLTPVLTTACAPKPVMPVMRQFKEQARQAHAARDARAAQLTRELEQREAGILAGTDLEGLGWLATRWFNLALVRADVGALPPPERLRALVPETVAAAAEQGFRLLASSGRVPTPAELADQAVKNGWPASDYAILAGADLLFADAQPELPPLPSDRLTSLLCLALARTTRSRTGEGDDRDRRPWVGRVVSALPGESAQALRVLIGPQLTAGSDHVSELGPVCRDEALAPVRPALIPDLLRLARRPYAFWLLARTALHLSSREEVHRIALDRLSQTRDAPLTERWPWLHLAWRLSPAQHEDSVRSTLASHSELHIDLAEATGDTLAGDNAIPAPLTLAHRALILRVFGPIYASVPLPGGVSGIPDAYQLGRLVEAQFDRLSTMPDEEAGRLLADVATDPAFAAHRDRALYSLAIWRREARVRGWKPPAVGAVAAALKAGPPASAADLVAFGEDHLRELNTTLRRTEDNQWRGFWNTDRHGRHTNAKVENVCRDQLMVLLRGRFEQVGLGMATEVKHAGEDRCDIVARALDRTLPIEVKCDYHSRLWTAWRDQLAECYAQEPKAAGTGIYLVFWFGPERGEGRGIRPAPGGSKPADAAELESKLSAMVEESGLPIRVVVLDVMPPKPRRRETGERSRRSAPTGKRRATRKGRPS